MRVQGVSLRVPAGSSCALVGTSGSGKSTVLRLLFRFYDPQGGAVEVAGQDVRGVTVGRREGRGHIRSSPLPVNRHLPRSACVGRAMRPLTRVCRLLLRSWTACAAAWAWSPKTWCSSTTR